MSVVELKGVSKAFAEAGDGTGAARVVLDGVDLTIGEGERIAVVGPSGCGKSTLLNIIGTLDRADSGDVKLFGEDFGGADEARLAKLRSQAIGFIFQLHHLLPQCNVLENVLVPTIAMRPKPSDSVVSERAKKLLDRVGLSGHLEKKPGQLSGGERQRVAVVRALINEPRLLLADEPTGALDEESAVELTQLLVELNEEQKVSVVMVTHDLRLAERIGTTYRLRQGKLEKE